MRETPSGFGLKFGLPSALSAFVIGGSLFWNGLAAANGTSLDINQYVHRSWKIREGFAAGFIETLAQTPDGYLWIGTAGGLYRFDGVRNIRWRPPHNQSLPDPEVMQLLAARDGRLWIGTFKGLASWKNGKLTRYPQFEGKATSALVEGQDGDIWARGLAFSGDGVLCRIRRTGAANCEHIRNNSEDFRAAQLLWDSRGTLWLSDSKQLWRWGPGIRRSYPLPGIMVGLAEDPDQPGAVLVATRKGIKKVTDRGTEDFLFSGAPSSFTPLSLVCDRNKDLWIATQERGVLHVHRGRADIFDRSDGLSGDFVTSILQDREGNIWVGTYDGLDSFHEPVVKTLAARQGLPNSTVTAVLAANDGSIWFAGYGGISRWNNGEITNFRHGPTNTVGAEPVGSGGANPSDSTKQVIDSNLPPGPAWSLYQDHSGRIWISTESGILYFENGRFFRVANLPAELANSFAEDDSGVWIGFRNKGLYHSAGDSVRGIGWAQLGKSSHGQSLFFDPMRKELWIGFIDGDVEVFKEGEIRRVFSTRNGLGGGTVSQLQGSEDGGIWAATQGGLSHIKNGRVATLNSRNGLPCDGVHWMIRGKRRSYWLYTPCGLIRIPPEQMTAWIADQNRQVSFRVLDRSDGVRTQPYPIGSSPLVTRTADGQVWFVPLDGVSVFDPQDLKLNRLPPPVHVEQITANGQTYDLEGGLRLPPLIHDLTINYTALSLVAPEKVHFRYKLEGQDRGWREYINDRQVQYSNLSPGSYCFRVTASNDSGVWNPTGASLAFSIAPAYWQTNWFQALCAAALVGLLATLYRFRLNQVERTAEKDRRAERRHHEIELELAHAGRAATMGQLTAAIAHEVNQPLAAIGTNANAARRWLGSEPPNLGEVRQSLDHIVRDVGRAAEIVSRVREIVTKTPDQKELVSPGEITTDVIAIVQSEATKHGVSIRTEFTDRVVAVMGHRVELQQVVLNLMINAIDAMSSTTDGVRELVVRTEVLEDRELLVSVRDSGPGLQPEAYDRIFKPYYTSKATGMGMGLSICRMIMDAHGGRIWASANEPHGAVFQFTLPTSQA